MVLNDTDAPSVVHVAFGSDSVVGHETWKHFCVGSGLTCQFHLGKHESRVLPLGGQYLNATMAFDATPSCGSTKAEVNVNNPTWYDVVDVSLVDGYSNKIKMTAVEPAVDAGPVSTTLGPPNGATGNEKVFGVYPMGCDICVARQSPPCGIKKGTSGCKTGSQYKPDVPCQYQGTVLGGGTAVTIALVH